MRKLGSCVSTTVGFLFFALLLALLVGPAIYVEVAGTNVPGAITARSETISVRAGVWNRRLLVEARITSPQATDDEEATGQGGAQIAVEPALYDRLRVGDAVGLRYVPVPILSPLRNTGFARLAEQPPLGALLATVRPLWGIVVGVAIGLALLAAWSRWHKGWLAAIFVIYMAGAALYVGSGWPPPAPRGPRNTAVATVRNALRVDRVWGGQNSTPEDAVQPYDIVELEFVPEGASGPVVAVDLVDAGSVPGLAKGARLPVHYSVENHRWAQLDAASRTYYWKNMRTFGIIAVIIVVALLVGWIATRRRAARRSSVAP